MIIISKKTICMVLIMILLSICCVFIPNMCVYASETQADLVESKSACLMDYKTGEIMYEQNADSKHPIASMVKLMTILLTFEEIDAGRLSLTEKITTSENASDMGGSQVFIDPCVDYSVEDLLKSVVVSSANDASVALAEKISGSEENFVKKMNDRAKSLKMNNTLYANCTGLPAPNHYSTARDICILNKQLIDHKNYLKYSTIWMDKLVHPSGRETELANTNKLIRYYKGCDCGKTGHTSEAGYCLSASAERNNFRIISTIIGAKDSKTRFNESAKLFNYGFNNFEYKPLFNKEQVLGTINVMKSPKKSVEVFASEAYNCLNKKGEDVKYDFTLKFNNHKNVAPIKKGEVVGKIVITKDAEIVKEIDLIVKTEVKSYSYTEAITEVLNKWALA